MKIKKFIKNEKGSGMLIIMVSMVFAAVFLSLLFFDFSNVFINKRVTQTGADASALAAAKTANEHMKERLQEETQEELDSLGVRWTLFKITNELATLADFVSMVEAEKGKSMPDDIKSWLENHSAAVEANTAMKFFFEDNEVNEMSCKAVRDHFDELKQDAEDYAKKNQNDQLTDITFIAEDFRIYVKTERKGKYTTVSDEKIPAITSESSARIGEPEGYDISCN